MGEPWKDSPSWGAQNAVRVDQLKTQPVSILGATEFPDMAAVRTVQCLLDFDPEAWPAGSTGFSRGFSLVGTVEFGVGGAMQTAEFDWANGVQLSFPAQVIKVSARLEGAVTDSTPAQLQASALISTGCPPRTRPPTRTITLQPLGSADALDVSVRIPRFGRGFTWSANVGAADAGVTLALQSAPSPGGVLVFRSYTAAQLADSALRGQYTPINEGARYVRVQAAAGLVVCGQLAFSLDI
jgi:hypothetical protein